MIDPRGTGGTRTTGLLRKERQLHGHLPAPRVRPLLSPADSLVRWTIAPSHGSTESQRPQPRWHAV